ncbi:MAG: hypothetical protein HY900_15205 [Deltaproteobacteria bacterium]|nr:hypothetical protein [Deltaproteobacteria bacterium]
MKRTAILALLAALFSFGATSFAADDDCTCKKPTTVSAPSAGELRHGTDYP